MNEFEKQVTELANEAAKEMVNQAAPATNEIVSAVTQQHAGIPTWAVVLTGVGGLGLGAGLMKIWDKFVSPKLQERKAVREIARQALKAQREAKRQAAMAAAQAQAQQPQQPVQAQAQIDPNVVNPTING